MFGIFSVPLSLDELIRCMQSCSRAEELKEKISLPVLRKGAFSQGRFIAAIRYPFESYTDLTFAKWKTFLTRLKVLFPVTDSKDAKALETFQAFVKKRIVAMTPSLAAALTPQPVEGLAFAHSLALRNGEWQKVHLTTEEYVEALEGEFLLSEQARLKKALEKEDVSSLDRRASAYQIILSLLMLEVNLMKLTSHFVEVALKIHELQAKLREGSILVMRISPYDEATLFEIPFDIEDSDEFALWLNLSPFSL